MCKIKHEQVTLNQGLPSPNSSPNVESNTVIDTSDNVAYGMFTRGRHYLWNFRQLMVLIIIIIISRNDMDMP